MTKNRLRQIIKEELLRESTMPRTDGAAGLFNVLGNAVDDIQKIVKENQVGVLPGISRGMPGLIFGPGVVGASAAADAVISRASSLGLGGMEIKEPNMSMSDAKAAFEAAEDMMSMMDMIGQVPRDVTKMVNAYKSKVFPPGGGSGYVFISMDLGAGAGASGMPQIPDVLGGMGGVLGSVFKEGSVRPARLKQIIKEELSRAMNEGWRREEEGEEKEYEPQGTFDRPTSYHRSGALKGFETGPAVETGLGLPKSGPTFYTELTDLGNIRQFNRVAEKYVSWYEHAGKDLTGAILAKRPSPSSKGNYYRGEYTIYKTDEGFVAIASIPEVRYEVTGLPAASAHEAIMNAMSGFLAAR